MTEPQGPELPSGNCPDRSRWSGYVLGTASPAEAEVLAEHLEHCAACDDLLQSLSGISDELIRVLQAAPGEERHIEESACIRAVRRVAKSPSLAGGSSISEGSASTEPSYGSGGAEQTVRLRRDEFLEFLTSNGLVTAGELAALLDAAPTADVREVEGVAKALVRVEKLTPYQATTIAQGRGKSLFYGDYLVLDRIGAGGMGQVFKARHRRMDRVVALKVIAPAASDNADAVRRFEREMRAAAKLTHPNIVHAYDAGSHGEVRYLVMEYVEGSDLSALLKKSSRLDPAQACGIIEQAARGLAAAHAKGLVHRDVKPGNLLIDKSGTVKVLDMGLSRIDDDRLGQADDEAEISSSGAVMGTVDYMAPEQAVDIRKADAKADVYGLGCTLYRALTGEPVYAGRTMLEKIVAHRERPIPSAAKLRPDVPPELDTLIQRMIAKRPDARPTMQETAAALAVFGRGGAAAHDSESPTSPLAVQTAAAAPPRKRTSLALWAAAGAGGLLLLAGIWIEVRNKDGKTIAVLEMPDGGSVNLSSGDKPPPLGTASGTRPAGPGPVLPNGMIGPPPRPQPTVAIRPPLLVPNQKMVVGRDGVLRPAAPEQYRVPYDPNAPISDGPIACKKLSAGEPTEGLAPGALEFDGPAIDGAPYEGRRGKGFIVKPFPTWREAGNAWTFSYRCNISDQGIVIVHPYGEGHFRMFVKFNRLGFITGGAWSNDPQQPYAPPAERIVTPQHGGAALFPLQEGVKYSITSRITADGIYTFCVNNQPVYGLSFGGGIRQLWMKPPFDDPKCPLELDVGQGALIIGPSLKAPAEILDARFVEERSLKLPIISGTSGAPLGVGMAPSSDIRFPLQIASIYPYRAKKPTEVFTARQPPDYLRNLTPLVVETPHYQTNVGFGLLSFRINAAGPVYMAAAFEPDGAPGPVKGQMNDDAAIQARGWKKIEEYRLRRFYVPESLDAEKVYNEPVTIYMRQCAVGEVHTFRTRTHGPPILFVPGAEGAGGAAALAISTAPENIDPTANVPPLPSAAADERKAAEHVLALGGTLALRTQSQARVSVTEVVQLPTEPFRIFEIRFDAAPGIVDDDLVGLRNLTALKILSLNGTNVTGEGFDNLTTLVNLENISLNQTHKFKEASLKHLSKLRNLRNFTADSAPLTDETLRHLKEVPSLMAVMVDDTRITGAGFADWPTSSRLHFIRLGRCPLDDAGLQHLQRFPWLRTLRIGYTRITDEGLMKTTGFGDLISLELKGTKTSDLSIPRLSKFTALRDITFGTKVTLDGIESFQKAVPECRVAQ